MLERGLYEKTIGTDLRRELDAEDDELVSQTERLDHADAARVLAAYAEEAVKQALDSIEGDDAPVRQARLVNSLIDNLASQLKDSDSRLSDLIEGERVDLSRTKPEQLLSLVPRQNASVAEQKKGLVRPLTSVAQTSLFTGAAHEPQLFSELRREIASADEILMLVSFVKWSGLRLLMDVLQEFADRGSRIRVITTTYMGATDPKAVSALAALPGASVRVSYDTKRTRLHAKAYVFRRKTGYTTAYVGSSNLTNPAMTSGLEWNLKISRADEADALDKIEGTFDAYWASPDFEPYTAADSKRLASAIAHEHGGDAEGLTSAAYAFDIRPYPYQQKILDALEAERTVGGHWKNLVVAATGTGKTVIAAFDYRRFCEREGTKSPSPLRRTSPGDPGTGPLMLPGDIA
jgi:HKD family nuclease